MPAGIVAGIASLIGAGAGAYSSIKSAKEQEKFSKKQEETQKKKEASLLKERKKKIDLMRRETLAPSIFGGRRSLIASGSERGITQTRGTLG